MPDDFGERVSDVGWPDDDVAVLRVELANHLALVVAFVELRVREAQ